MGYLREVDLGPSFPPFAAFREHFGFIPNLFRAQTLLPRVIEAEAGIAAAVLLKEQALSRMRKEYILLTLAAAHRNAYCVTEHYQVLLLLGASEQQLDQIILAISEALTALDRTSHRGAVHAACLRAVARARDFLDANIEHVVRSAELEAITGLSRFALARHFRACLGTSPYRYLVMRRLDRARHLMLSGASLAEVATSSGFADQSHMTRQFKRAYGLSPGHWQKIVASAPIANVRMWHITSMPGLIGTAAIEGRPDHPAISERHPPTGHSAKSQAVSVLPIGARGGPRHHRGTANE